MTEDRVDLELIRLEELFNEESRCEMKHLDSACSAAVTHVAVDCRRQFLICSTAHQIVKKMIEQNSLCRHCNLPSSSCWRVVPV